MHKVTVLPLGIIGIEPPQELLPATFLVNVAGGTCRGQAPEHGRLVVGPELSWQH
jgi:hypothetical protein